MRPQGRGDGESADAISMSRREPGALATGPLWKREEDQTLGGWSGGASGSPGAKDGGLTTAIWYVGMTKFNCGANRGTAGTAGPHTEAKAQLWMPPGSLWDRTGSVATFCPAIPHCACCGPPACRHSAVPTRGSSWNRRRSVATTLSIDESVAVLYAFDKVHPRSRKGEFRWHSLRWKFASELKTAPLRDLRQLGGCEGRPDHPDVLHHPGRGDAAGRAGTAKNAVR